jgi:peptidoglycan/xylan/chitin deacetylase (PgdA/CDA1 family)
MTEISPQFCAVWPEGFRAAASFTFDLDAEAAVLTAVSGSASRMSVMSHQEYGPLVGVPRLLRLLSRLGIQSTFFVPGYTAHRYPNVVRSIVAEGHEIAHHGYLHEPLGGVDEASEIEYLERGLNALAEVAGVRPLGYRAPMWELNYRSPRLLHDRDFLYDSSLMNGDAPYELSVEGRSASIVEIPINWGFDDWEQYCYIPDAFGSGVIESPAKTEEMWLLDLAAMREEGGCFVHTSHPFLSGRPARAAALGRVMAETIATGDVWVATMSEIALHVRSQQLQPYEMQPPLLDFRGGRPVTDS